MRDNEIISESGPQWVAGRIVNHSGGIQFTQVWGVGNEAEVEQWDILLQEFPPIEDGKAVLLRRKNGESQWAVESTDEDRINELIQFVTDDRRRRDINRRIQKAEKTEENQENFRDECPVAGGKIYAVNAASYYEEAEKSDEVFFVAGEPYNWFTLSSEGWVPL